MSEAKRSGGSSVPVMKVRQIVEGLGYECVGVQMLEEYGRGVLRIYIDSLGGIQVKDCETVSRAVARFLDENEELFPGKYLFEVSSPGLDRPLFNVEDFQRFKGKKIRIRLAEKIEKKRQFVGVLKSVEEGIISIEDEEGQEISVPFHIIHRANLVYEEPPKKAVSRKRKKGE
jgi:ribosome maturation factor RimP